MRKCKIDGCENAVFGKECCKFHYSKTPIKSKKKAIPKYSEKGLLKKEEKKKWLEELHKWELSLWDKLENEYGYIYCYETGKPMHRDVYRENLCIYSHCYPKNKYPQMAMLESNILLVLPEIHAQWEIDQKKCPKMLNYFNKLKNLETS